MQLALLFAVLIFETVELEFGGRGLLFKFNNTDLLRPLLLYALLIELSDNVWIATSLAFAKHPDQEHHHEL